MRVRNFSDDVLRNTSGLLIDSTTNIMRARGYMIQHSGVDDSDDENEDDEDEWLDYHQIIASDGGNFLKRKKLSFIKASLQGYDGIKQECKGRFLLTDPWWDIILNMNDRRMVKGPVQYNLRTDTQGILRHKLVMLLLNKVVTKLKFTHQFMTDFEAFIRETGQETKTTFNSLKMLLGQYKKSRDLTGSKLKEFVQILHSEDVQLVLRAQQFPALMSFLCTLFPTFFIDCLLAPPVSVLSQMDEAATKEPWIFGFSKILSNRFKLFGIEAKLKDFCDAGLLEKLSQREKDALYIYAVLKHDAARNGHTYISIKSLMVHKEWRQLKHEVVNWSSSLQLLRKNEVTCEEHFNSERNIFLYHNWKAEVDIARGLHEVLKRGMTAEESWQMDFSSCEVDCLRNDPDQWAAAQKLVGSPICVMSGKGGCGKTTVVSQVIRSVCLGKHSSANTEPHECHSAQHSLELGLHTSHPLETPRTNNHADLNKTSVGMDCISSEQLARMLDHLTKSQKDKMCQIMLEKDKQIRQQAMKKTQLYTDLCTDLVHFQSSSADTSLSDTYFGSKILLTAPTGKAAKLLGHKAKMESFTLHHVIYSYRAFVKAQKENGKPEELWKYTKTQVLIVDECSLVCLRLFATLLNILINNSLLQKVILLGDIRQLPSIEAGNFLTDVFSFFQERGLGIELKTNHRAESDLIVRNATRISMQRLPYCDSSQHFHLIALPESSERNEEILHLLQSQSELKAHETSQFVAFRRSDCLAINELCCRHYNQHSIDLPPKPNSLHHRHYFDFRVGDKICFRRNGMVRNFGKRLMELLCTEFADVLTDKSQSTLSEKDSELKASSATDQLFTHEDNLKNGSLGNKIQDFIVKAEKMSESSKKESSAFEISSHDLANLTAETCAIQATSSGIKMERGSHGWDNSFSKSGNLSGEKASRDVLEAGDSNFSNSDHPASDANLESLSGDWEDSLSDAEYFLCESDIADKSIDWDSSLSDSDCLASEFNLDGISEDWEDILSDGSCHTSDTNLRVTSEDQEEFPTNVGHLASEMNLDGRSQDLEHVLSDAKHSSETNMGSMSEVLGSSFAGTSQQQSQSIAQLEPSCSTSPDALEPCHCEDVKKKEKPSDETVWLCNGEVFFIMHETTEIDMNGKEFRYVMLSDRDPACPRVYCCSFNELKRICKLQHSWARTIHTYQGSESDVVIYYVGNATGQTCKHVYTAVTRGRRAVFMVGKLSELEKAIFTRDFPRRSRLRRRLHNELKDFDMQNLHARMRQTNKQAKAALEHLPHTHASTCEVASCFHSGATSSIETSPESTFADCDDSWVQNLSAHVADGNIAALAADVTVGASCIEDSLNKTGVSTQAMQTSSNTPDHPLLTPPNRSRCEFPRVCTTPGKRPIRVEELVSPKRLCGSNSVDSIVSPLRRKLNI